MTRHSELQALNYTASPAGTQMRISTFGQEVRAIGIALLVALTIGTASAPANAYSSTVLMHKVNAVLRANDNLNGASAYTASPGVVVLYGTVFDDKDRVFAEQTASKVPGVKHVINTLRTKTGVWLGEESSINDTLQLNGFEDVSVRVIGNQAYLSGQVSSEAEKQRAANVVSSVSKLQINNVIWVKPGPLISTPSFF
jgi:BON domain